MPFVQRVVQPVQLSRVLLHDEQGRPRVKDDELEAVTNHTLSSALRQLASVVLLADEIFQDLGKILGDVTERSKRLRVRIAAVDEKASQFDPKAVTVPESDLTIFSSLKEHYKREQCVEKGLFTADSRPVALRRLYEAAAPTPVPVVRQLDRYRRDGLRSSRFFAVTPVMGGKRRRPTKANDMDIETRTPAVVSKLRMWTSLEALGDVTVDPDCTHKIDASAGNDDVDHRLPSPEEQVQAVALKFPAEIVKVDVSGRSFNRMSALRRSLMHVECDDSSRRRHKSRRGRSKRRNTIAGTDTKELAAIVCDSSDTNFGKSTPDSVPCGATISSAEKKSHLESLKEWGRSRLRLIKNSEPAVRLRERSLSSRRKWDKEKDEPHLHSSSGNWSASSESGQSTATSHHPRSSISSGSTCQKHGRRTVMVSTSSSVTSESTLTPDDGETCSMYSCDTEGYYTSFHMDSGLKTLREEDPLPALQSTSALSGSRINSSSLTADSEYELFGKGSTSTTASSAGTVCTTLIIPPPSVPERINSHLSSERNVKSLTNLSSEKTPPLNKEGAYYRTDNKSNTDPCRGRSVSDIKKVETVKSNLTKENVSKLKEQYNDNVQADKNCMIMVEVHHEGGDDKNEKCGDSPDSGHNTCSSPVDSVTSPSLDLEMSECSDLEGVDRVERIRVKTTINSSRIPSMCVITPPQSDDEVSLNAMKTAAVDIGDYVTIADVRHKENAPAAPVPTPVPISPVPTRDTEYVSLNELPSNDSLERKRRQGARVTLDSEGKVVYSSDSLRRRKAIHTTGTFDPGPNVATTSSPVMQHRVINIRPVVTSNSPILRGDRRLASATLTPTTQKIISASQQIISRPLSPLVGSKKNIITESTTTNTLTSKTDTLKKVDNKTVTLTNNQTNTGLVSLVAQRRLSPSNQKQYFPKSSYGNMSPVATSNRPMSPLVLSNNPKITNISNGKRSQTPPTSPVKSPTLSSRPLSPKNVVKANLSRAVSPTSPRGAYVRVKDATGPDDDSKMVKRSDSYRMANDDTKTVFNPNVLGRKQYGAGIVAGPKLLTAIQTVQANKESKTREEGSSAASGGASPPRQWQDTWPQRTPQTDVRSSTPTKPNTPPMNITSTLSPIRSMTPTHSTRSPMDLYAIIHESKKKIMKLKGKQSPEPPTTAPQTSKQVNWPKCIPTTQGKSNMMDQSHEQLKLPSNGQYQRLSPSPTPSTLYVDRGSVVAHPSHSLPRKLNSPPTKIENNLNRYSPTNRSQYSPPQPMPNLPTRNYASLDRKFSPKSNFRQPSSSRSGLPHSTSRNDFKQLLLRTGWSSTSPGKPSAVERLKNNKPAVPAVPSPKRKTWKSDVLSSTILEDCDEADGPSQREVSAILQTARNRPDVAIPKSSALVSQQCKAFQARSSPTLETAL